MQFRLKTVFKKVLFLILLNFVAFSVFCNPTPHKAVNLNEDTSQVIYSVFLIGGSGSLYLNENSKELLKQQFSIASENSTAIFLGDNVDMKGLPDSSHRNWAKAKKSILSQLDILKNYKGKAVYIPGNNDWAKGQKQGLKYIKKQKKYIENFLGQENVFLPKKGRPGPVEIALTEDIVLIVIDSHWWFHDFKKSYSGIEDEADFFIQIRDAVNRNRNKKIIFAAHHPLYSRGKYGGKFPFSYNIFPLQEINKNLFIPLPGFFYTGYRKFLGAKQDISHPEYKVFRNVLIEIFNDQSDIIYAAGHEKNLQYSKKGSIHHIVSG